jgi:rubrerythrin
MNISLGNNPFLTVTVDELENNIAEATKRLENVKSTQNWRKNLHHCVRCGTKLSKDYLPTVCANCMRRQKHD